jgi:hypothetical protein
LDSKQSPAIPSVRDQLVLLLIAETRMKNPRTLGLRLDMCDFPGNESKSVSNLVNNRLIYFSQINGFGHAIKYAVTNNGEEFLNNHIDHVKIIEHIKNMQNPDFMLELVQTIFDRMKTSKDNIAMPTEPDRSKWTAKNFEFLITGDLEITAENHDEIMTPNSFEWTKIEKDNWPYYQVGQDEFSYSWEPSGIQMTFNEDITFQKAKNIADEIIENIHRTGQFAELVILESGKIYKF